MTSLRAARLTTSPPMQVMRNPKKATLPHCPGETQTRSVVARRRTMAKQVGLKRCFPFQRRMNLLAMAMTAATAMRRKPLLRRRSESESAEMAALFRQTPAG